MKRDEIVDVLVEGKSEDGNVCREGMMAQLELI